MTHIDDALRTELIRQVDCAAKHTAKVVGSGAPHGLQTELFALQGDLLEIIRLLRSSYDPYVEAVEDHIQRERREYPNVAAADRRTDAGA